MGAVWINVDVLIDNEFITMFRNVKIEVEEMSNKKMERAFETEHPRLLRRIPTLKNSRDFTFRCPFRCEVVRSKF
jgi:hypothetical protein